MLQGERELDAKVASWLRLDEKMMKGVVWAVDLAAEKYKDQGVAEVM